MMDFMYYMEPQERVVGIMLFSVIHYFRHSSSTFLRHPSSAFRLIRRSGGGCPTEGNTTVLISVHCAGHTMEIQQENQENYGQRLRYTLYKEK